MLNRKGFLSYNRLAAICFAVAAMLAICLVVMLSGCGKVWMSAEYKEQMEMSNVVIQSLNADCQAGDPNACRQGLAESAEIVQLIVDAANGVDSQGGDSNE